MINVSIGDTVILVARCLMMGPPLVGATCRLLLWYTPALPYVLSLLGRCLANFSEYVIFFFTFVVIWTQEAPDWIDESVLFDAAATKL